MTLTFAILLGIIFLMEIGAGIAAYHLKGQVLYALHVRCTTNSDSSYKGTSGEQNLHTRSSFCAVLYMDCIGDI
jgi:hypothetical protein